MIYYSIPLVPNEGADSAKFMALPFPNSKLVKGCTTGFVSAFCHGLFPVKTSVECRMAGIAPKQYEQKWWFITFPYKGNQRSWQIDTGLQERHRTREGSGKVPALLPSHSPEVLWQSCTHPSWPAWPKTETPWYPHRLLSTLLWMQKLSLPQRSPLLSVCRPRTLKPTRTWKWHYWVK